MMVQVLPKIDNMEKVFHYYYLKLSNPPKITNNPSNFIPAIPGIRNDQSLSLSHQMIVVSVVDWWSGDPQ